jgi:hypothetical protein
MSDAAVGFVIGGLAMLVVAALFVKHLYDRWRKGG